MDSKLSSNAQMPLLTDPERKEKGLPAVPAGLMLCGTRPLQYDNQEFQSGYISDFDVIQGVIKIRWYCPRSVAPLPKEIKGHVLYTIGRFAELIALYGIGTLERIIRTHRPHIQFRVSVWPADRHATGNLIYIASSIHFTPANSDIMLSYASNLVNGTKVRSEDQVSDGRPFVSFEDDDTWRNYRWNDPQPSLKLEVMLKPEKD